MRPRCQGSNTLELQAPRISIILEVCRSAFICTGTPDMCQCEMCQTAFSIRLSIPFLWLARAEADCGLQIYVRAGVYLLKTLSEGRTLVVLLLLCMCQPVQHLPRSTHNETWKHCQGQQCAHPKAFQSTPHSTVNCPAANSACQLTLCIPSDSLHPSMLQLDLIPAEEEQPECIQTNSMLLMPSWVAVLKGTSLEQQLSHPILNVLAADRPRKSFPNTAWLAPRKDTAGARCMS